MPVIKVYPDVGSGGSSVDGSTTRSGVSEIFSTIRNGLGTGASTSATNSLACGLRASTTANQFFALTRGVFMFDTSFLGSLATINSATISFMPSINGQTNLGNTTINLNGINNSFDNNIVSGDYQRVNATAYSSSTPNVSTVVGGTRLDFPLNASGLSLINKTGVTAFSLRLGWDRSNLFAGTWSSGVETALYIYFADDSTITNRPYLEIDYTPNFVEVPIDVDLDSSTDIDPSGTRRTKGTSDVDSITSLTPDSNTQRAVTSLIESYTTMEVISRVDRVITSLVATNSDIAQAVNYIAGGNVTLDSVSNLITALVSERRATLDIDTASTINLLVDKLRPILTEIDSSTDSTVVPSRGRVTTLDTIASSSLVDSFIKNMPVNFVLGIDSVTALRLSFIVPVILEQMSIDSATAFTPNLIFGLIDAVLNWLDHNQDIITKDGTDAIQFKQSGLTNIRTTIPTVSDLIGSVGWQTIIYMDIDSNSDVIFSFARFKRVTADITSSSDLDLTSEMLGKMMTEVISQTEVQNDLKKYVFGTTDVQSLTGVEEYVKSERYLELNIQALSNTDALAKGLMKILMAVTSVSDLVAVLKPIVKLSVSVLTESELELTIINQLKAVLDIDTESDLIEKLQGTMLGTLGIDSKTNLLAYIREIVAPFPYIVVKFSREFRKFGGSTVGSGGGVDFSCRQFRTGSWVDHNDFAITNELAEIIKFLQEIN